MAVAKVGPSGLPIPMGGIMDTLEGGKGYFGPTRVGPLPGGTISNPFKALINLMSKKDDDDIIDVKEEELIKLDKKDVSTGDEDPDKDPKKKTTVRPLSSEEVAKKLVEEGVGEVIDKGVEKLKGKYKDLDKQKKLELEQDDTVNLEK